MNNKLQVLALSLLVWLGLQLIYTFAHISNQNDVIAHAVSQIEKRVALDLPRLALPDQALNNVGDQNSVLFYIKQLNNQLAQQNYPITLLTIKGIPEKTTHVDYSVILLAPGHAITLQFSKIKKPLISYLSVAPFVCFLLFLYLSYHHYKITAAKKVFVIAEEVEKVPLLIIDLHEKVLINSISRVKVPLANKPLCFYIALSQYCAVNKESLLNQNKDLPIELIDLANKYFHRLIELGHTVRKRPNFTNSLEKTLSEIRAALDEVFANAPEIKEIYYPPKAQGEGSRSKLHHYGLALIQSHHVELIGK